jgi:hypothetical protein
MALTEKLEPNWVDPENVHREGQVGNGTGIAQLGGGDGGAAAMVAER